MTTGPLTVPTPFNDINELAESFASRVDEERLMLPFEHAITEGEWVQFAVTLADESVALAGSGRCSGCYDNGTERDPQHRFDIVLDMLELDEMAQIYFERILMARAAQAGAEPATGEVPIPAEADVSLSDVVDVSETSIPSMEAYDPVPESSFESSELEFAAADSVESEPDEAHAPPAAMYDDEPSEPAPWTSPSAPPPPPADPRRSIVVPALGKEAIYSLPPPSKPGELPTPHGNGVGLTRRSLSSAWSPEPAPRPDPSSRTGLFQYGSAALPQPAQPPRPDLNPSLRVRPAPRPGDPHEAVPMRARVAVAAYAAPTYATPADDYDAPSYEEPATGEIDLDDQGSDVLDVDVGDDR